MTSLDPTSSPSDRNEVFRVLQEELTHGRPLAMLLVDIDHFKSINDAFGHRRGDDALDALVRTVRVELHREAYRYAGDEFIIVLPDHDATRALHVAEQLVRAVSGTPVPGDPPLTLSVSVGVAATHDATRPPDQATTHAQWTPESLFETADRALYIAKRAGRGRAALPQDLPPGTDTHDGRPIERDAALRVVVNWATELQAVRRAILTVDGPGGVGKTRFLIEAERTLRLRGYATLHLRATPALSLRLYGTLTEADLGFLGDESFETPLLERLKQYLADKRRAGLVILIDSPEHLDAATDAWLRGTLASHLPTVGVLLTGTPEPWQGSLDHPEWHVTLAPLTLPGTRSWLRSRLRQEPPGDLTAWLHDYTSGLPARLESVIRTWQAAGGTHLTLNALQGAVEATPPTRPELPLPEGGFVGRAAELRRIREWIKRTQLVSIVGPGGIGKTRLALQVAAEIAPNYPDGVAFVPLATERPERVLGAISRALGLELAGATPRARLLQWLPGRSVLLVLDNADAILEATPAIEDLLRAASGLRVLATTRETFASPLERAVTLAGLPVDETRRPTGPSDAFGAVAFFLHRATRAAPDLRLQPGDLLAVHDLCGQVGGSPLALEIAAAWLPTLTPREIAVGIRAGLHVVGVGADQPNVRAVLQHFWAQLSDTEARAVRRLAVFRGPFTARAARGVADASPFLLAGLVSRAYLKRRGATFSLHEMLRQDAQERLVTSGDEHTHARTALLTHYLHVARAGLTAEEYEAERVNVHQAIDLALDADRTEEAAHAALATRHLLRRRGEADSARGFLERAARQLPPGRLQAECLVASAELDNFLGSARAASEQFHAVLPHLTRESDLRARVLAGLSRSMHRLGQYDAAREHAEEAVRLAQSTGDQRLEAQCRRAFARALLSVRELEPARLQATHALDLYVGARDPEGGGPCLNLLALIATERGDFNEARSRLEAAIDLARCLEDRPAVALNLMTLGWTALLAGDFHEALRRTNASLGAYRQMGVRFEVANALTNLGHIHTRLKDHEAARSHYLEAAREASVIDAPTLALEVLAGLTDLGARDGSLSAEEAAARVAFVTAHPRCNPEVRSVTNATLEHLRATIGADALERALAAAPAVNLMDVLGSVPPSLQEA